MGQQRSFIAITILTPLLTLVLYVALNSPISSCPPFFTSNNILAGGGFLGEGVLEGPEDVCFDSKGTLYTVTRDGWIKRSLLGMNRGRNGGLLAARRCSGSRSPPPEGLSPATPIRAHCGMFSLASVLLLDACIVMAAASSRRLWVLAHPIPLHRCYHSSPPSHSLSFTRRQRSDSRAPALAVACGCGNGTAKGVKKKASDNHLKRQTRLGEAFDRDQYKRYADPASGHVPVLLG